SRLAACWIPPCARPSSRFPYCSWGRAAWNQREFPGLVGVSLKQLAGGGMRGDHRTAVAAAALFVLGLAVTVAVAGNDAPGDKPAPATPPPAATPEVTILNKHEVEGILGRDVRSAADENMGRVVDVLVDRTGQVRAAIIDFGGFLGVGSRK